MDKVILDHFRYHIVHADFPLPKPSQMFQYCDTRFHFNFFVFLYYSTIYRLRMKRVAKLQIPHQSRAMALINISYCFAESYDVSWKTGILLAFQLTERRLSSEGSDSPLRR